MTQKYLNVFLQALLGLGIVLLASMPMQASAQSVKIGYVDLQRALNEVTEGKAAKKKLKKEFDAKQKKLDVKQKNVKKMKEELEAQAMMLAEDARRQKAMELQRHMYELQQLYIQLQGELAKKEAAATKKIFDKMGKIIDKIGNEHSYDLILEKSESSVLFAKPNMDITSELIKRYNKK